MTETDTQAEPPSEAKPETVSPEPKSEAGKKSLLSSPWVRYGGLSLVVFGLGSFAGHYTADRYGHRAAGQAIQINDKIKGLEAELTTARSTNSEMKAQLSRLERELKAVPKTQAAAEPVDLSGIENRLVSLENREPAETQIIDPELLSRLEALKTEGSEALDLADIYTRIEALESATPEPADPPDLTDIYARLEMLETARVAASEISAPVIEADTVIIPGVQAAIPEFPKAALLAALPDESQKNWLQKQITVRGPNDPSLLIEKIPEDIFNENWAAAAQKYDKLPDNIRSVGQDWRDAIESRL